MPSRRVNQASARFMLVSLQHEPAWWFRWS